MKATQDNAAWVSNTYEQGSSEDNWEVFQLKHRAPREPLVVESATTTSATVHAPYGSPGATENYVLYNSTDGEVPYTVSVSNNVATSLSGDNYSDVSSSDKTDWCGGATDACAGIFTADGNYAYFKSLTAGFWFKVGLPTPFKLDNALNTLESTFSLTSAASEDGTKNMMVSYAAGGNFIYLWGQGQTVARYTLTTPYLMETATDLQTYDFTSYLDDLSTSGVDQMGFSGLKVSADGTKGVCCLKLWGNTNGNGYIPNYLQGFTLGTPFDLGTITVTSESNLMGFDSSGEYVTAFSVSESGDHIQGILGPYNGTPYYRSYYLNTPWDVTSGSSVTSEYLNNWHSASTLNTNQHSILYNKQDNLSYAVWQGTWKRDIGFLNGGRNPYPTATLTYTSAGLTVAPTAIYKDVTPASGVSYLALTRAEAAKENVAIAFSESSTGTSLVAYTDLDNQGSTALNSTDLVIDGASFTTTSPTFTDNALSFLGSNTSKPTGGTKETELRTHMSFVGAYQLLNPSTYGYLGPTWDSPQGMAFDHTGTRFWLSGFADNFGGDANIDKAIVEFVLTTPWDLGTASLVKGWDADGPFKGESPTINVNYQAQAFQFNYDGSKFYIMHSYSSGGLSYLFEGTLSTPYDLSTYSYSHHVELGSLIGDSSPYAYDFTIAPDGQAIEVNKSQTTGDITTAGNCDSVLLKMTTPWTLSSIGYKRTFASSNGYRTSMIGSADTGYVSYSVGFNTGSNYNTLYIGTASGNLTSDVQNHFDGVHFTSYVTDYTNNVAGSGSGGKTLVVDNGTKLYIHVPETHTVLMFTGPFGFFADRYTIDITSLGLSERPSDVRFATADTYTSAGSTSLNATTNLYKEYATPEVSINAEALRFKIEGDTGATVTQVNVDLFT